MSPPMQACNKHFVRKCLANIKELVDQYEKDNDFNVKNDGGGGSYYSANHEQEPVGNPAA
jgi:hypothetical protein